MKRKFKLITIISMLCCLICIYTTGCKTYYWTINHPVEEIAQILVIDLDDGADGELLMEIDEQFYRECVEDILKLEAHKYFPSPTHPSGKAFKIIFKNGEYDLISSWEPQHWIFNNDSIVSCNRTSWLCFNKEEFAQLIDKWTNN